MLPYIERKWAKIFLCYMFIFSTNDIFAAFLKRNGQSRAIDLSANKKIILKTSMRTEDLDMDSGFSLNEEDMAKFHIWPSGIIPYYIDDFSFDKVLRDRLRMYLDNVNRLTGLQFVEIPKPPADETSKWVIFINRKGLLNCADYTFKNFTNEGVQRVVLGYHCLYSDDGLADTVLSLVGVPPQHTSPDRDAHISVNKENIIPDKLYLFDKLKDTDWLFHNIDYDFLSAGHYGIYKHTLNGSATYELKDPDLLPKNINKEKGFSDIDILKIKMLYNYISRSRETPSNLPECSKLFKPSNKLTGSISMEPIDEIKPWPKPSQYLGKLEKDDKNKDENDYEFSDDNENINEKDPNDSSDQIDNQYNDNNIYNFNDSSDMNNNEYNESNGINYNTKTQTQNEMKFNLNNQGIDTDSNESVELDDSKLEGNIHLEENHHQSAPNLKERLSLAFKLDTKKQKLLGQSDYETGDEGKKKYIHEKKD